MAMAAVDLDQLYPRLLDLTSDTELKICQSEIGDVGCVVWDAALVLCKYLVKSATQSQVNFKKKTAVDVGSGTGVVGLVTAFLGATSFITDLPDFLPLMQHNITQNSGLCAGSCTAVPLSWGDSTHIQALKALLPDGVDFITVADCVYYNESLEPLIQTIRQFSSSKTSILCSYEDRDTGNKPELQGKFLEMMSDLYEVSEVPLSAQDPQYRSPDIHIMKFTLKNDY